MRERTHGKRNEGGDSPELRMGGDCGFGLTWQEFPWGGIQICGVTNGAEGTAGELKRIGATPIGKQDEVNDAGRNGCHIGGGGAARRLTEGGVTHFEKYVSRWKS